jgi:adenylate cyclase
MAGGEAWVGQALLYIPEDRRAAIALGRTLPEDVKGTALFADICGFTTLTEAFSGTLGLRHGAEELPRYLNTVYDALIAEVNRYGGSVIGFTGDAITCWFDDDFPAYPAGDSTWRAMTCALRMQSAIQAIPPLALTNQEPVTLAIKAALACGPARRFVVGDAAVQLFDVLAGETLYRMAEAEHYAAPGEVLVDQSTAERLSGVASISEWRKENAETEQSRRFAVIASLDPPIQPAPWANLNADQFNESQVSSWVHPVVRERLQTGAVELLTELRPTVAVFLRFTGIDYDRDPHAGSRLNEYVCAVQKIVHQMGGSLLEISTGDKGSYMYLSFGACVGHEDDARRAVSTALQLAKLNTGIGDQGQVQIGVTRGIMRTGGYGGSNRRSFGALGDDVNLAARLMSRAAAGEVLVSRRVHKEVSNDSGLLSKGFTFEPRPPIRLKGKAEPIPVFAITGLWQRRSFRLQEPTYGLPMVGREAELALMDEKIALVLSGKGQVVGITGEPGLGKSRLTAEIIRLSRGKGLEGYGGSCQFDGIQMPYLVWKPIWCAFFDLDPEAPLRRQLRGLEIAIADLAPDRLEALPLLGELLGIPLPENDFTRALEPKHRRSALEALLLDCLRARARESLQDGGGLLLVLEDLHWIDSASHDLLERVARAIPDLPVLVVLAYRPPEIARIQEPRVETLPHFTRLRLNELTHLQMEQALRAKLAQLYPEWRAAVPKKLIQRVIDQSQGNPFFAEELINYLHDRDLDLQDQAILEKIELPNSLNSLVISRIDQLAASQQLTIKVSSVLGRVFRFQHLLGYFPKLGEPAGVKSDLDILAACELTPLDTPEPELAYLFKHLITHAVAYELLPQATRDRLHEQYAAYLETRTALGIDIPLDQIAYHYDHSQNLAKKCEYLVKVGQAAQRRYANDVALDAYQRALALISAEEKPDVLVKLGQVLELVGRWEEAAATYGQAMELSESFGDRRGQARCLTCLGELHRKGGRYSQASQCLDRAGQIFNELGDQAGTAQVLHFQGTVAAHQGELDASQLLYEQALAIRRAQDDKAQAANLLSNLGILARIQAQYDQARRLNEEALSLRKEVGDKWAIAVSLNNLGNVATNQGWFEEARRLHEEGLALRREVGDMWVVANSLNNLGNLARDQGDIPEAADRYRESLKIVSEYNDRWAMAYLLEDMGCLACLQGQPERALRLVGAAEALRQAIGSPRTDAEQHKLDSLLENARVTLGEPAASQRLEEGRKLNYEQAAAYAAGSE